MYLSVYPFALLVLGTAVSRFIRLPAAPQEAGGVWGDVPLTR